MMRLMTPNIFDAAIDWVMESTAHHAINGVSIGAEPFSDLDFADNIALLSEWLGYCRLLGSDNLSGGVFTIGSRG